MNDVVFVAQLYAAHLLPGDSRTILQSKSTPSEKALYFLDHMIEPSVKFGFDSRFYGLIEVMEDSECNGVKELAKLMRISVTGEEFEG